MTSPVLQLTCDNKLTMFNTTAILCINQSAYNNSQSIYTLDSYVEGQTIRSTFTGITYCCINVPGNPGLPPIIPPTPDSSCLYSSSTDFYVDFIPIKAEVIGGFALQATFALPYKVYTIRHNAFGCGSPAELTDEQDLHFFFNYQSEGADILYINEHGFSYNKIFLGPYQDIPQIWYDFGYGKVFTLLGNISGVNSNSCPAILELDSVMTTGGSVYSEILL